MELDELKQHWKQTDNIPSPDKQNIMDLIQNKSYGPVAELKRSYRRLMSVMILIPVAVFLTNLTNLDAMISSIIFWVYIAFCAGLFVYGWISYQTVKQMERTEQVVKEHLTKQLSILSTRLRQKLIFQWIALIVLIALTEIMPYFQDIHLLNSWHSLSPFIRFGAYAALLFLQQFATRRVAQARYGQHLERLSQLVKDME
jgi:Ca2+/Na+ antiporter